VHYYLGVDWADQTHAVWVVDERGTKITARTVPHTAEGSPKLESPSPGATDCHSKSTSGSRP
jgi:hypothetical protein